MPRKAGSGEFGWRAVRRTQEACRSTTPSKQVALQAAEIPAQKAEELVREIARKHGASRTALIPLLQEVQSHLGYLPRWSLELTSSEANIPLSTLYGICTFYHQFTLEPPGQHIIQLCMGTACYIRGNSENYTFLLSLLRLGPSQTTTEDELFTLLRVRCLGCCSLAPVMRVDDHIYGKLDFKTIRGIINANRAEARRKNLPTPSP